MNKLQNEVIGVFDVGSNSVRCLAYSGGNILYESLVTSRLGEGLATSGKLSPVAIMRTVSALEALRKECAARGATRWFAFATEAVRSAENGGDLICAAKDSGFDVDVISGDEEAEIGLLGALGGRDGGVLDIGGASAEIAAAKGGKMIYSRSVPLGAVRLNDACGEDEAALLGEIESKLPLYGCVPAADYRFIGGTATAVCMIAKGIKKFSRTSIDGRVLTDDDLSRVCEAVRGLSPEERSDKFGISLKRAEIIVGGALLARAIARAFGMDRLTVSLSDNMLGYIRKKVDGEGYDKA